jgi:hypothetical protein
MRTSLKSSAVLAGALALVSVTAHADVLFSTANYNSAESGDYSLDAATFLATSFTLTQAEQISEIDGHFTQFGDGNSIFAAISSAANLSAWSSNVVSDTVFTPNTDGTDTNAAWNVTLNPGTYYLVLGAGLYGSTGQSGLATGQDVVGNPSFFQSFDGGATWSAQPQNDLRVALQGAAVPVPAAWPLLLSGLAALGVLGRRKA